MLLSRQKMKRTINNQGPSGTASSSSGKTNKCISTVRFVIIVVALISTIIYIIFNEITTPETFSNEFINILQATTTTSTSNDVPTILINATTTTFLNGMEMKDGGNEHRVAGLNCNSYGGPYTNEATERMIYWKDIPDDNKFSSPLKHPTEEQFLTMEPDEGGWNNIRMNMETAVGIAIMTGRTLVLPPKKQIYLLHHGDKEDKQYTFNDFFHFDSVFAEHYTDRLRPAFKVITFDEFLEQVAMTGKFISRNTTLPTFPPNNRTNWDGSNHQKLNKVWDWIRQSALPLEWNSERCVGAFPSQRGYDASTRIPSVYLQQINNPNNISNPRRRNVWKDIDSYIDNPTPVDDTPVNRLREILGHRVKVCMYDDVFQNAKVLHTLGSTNYRLLVHFYAFLYFENYQLDLWFKRFVRDHFRYVDEVQCAAARIIDKLKTIAKRNNNGDTYDSMHIRRGDLQFEEVRQLSAEDIYELTVKKFIKPNRTMFIATDERDMTFFNVLKDHYNVYFLHDFQEQLGDTVSKNFYGMIDQLVASQGITFVGCYYSTFTGYINRIRGYHHQNQKLPGYELGHVNSYYYVPNELMEKQAVMTQYRSVQPTLWSQEYAVCWRDIDHDLEAD
jgi:GDP-fucose protein O-fucosyltransferase